MQVTNGGSEANYITTWNLVEPGDEVVMMVPNYMQTWGLARAFGATVKPWPLVPPEAGAADGASTSTRSNALVSPRTKLIVICNPNNPTGARFDGRRSRSRSPPSPTGTAAGSSPTRSTAAPSATAARRRRSGADRIASIVTSGLSKAYGLPGLRIGWIVGPPSRIASLWAYHDYTTIAPGALSDALARRALEPARRARASSRGRAAS